MDKIKLLNLISEKWVLGMEPASIFIMDVSKSSAIGEDLSSYLAEIESFTKTWYEGSIKAQVKHRAGDEIIFIGQGYSSAYIIAFFLSKLWKYRNNPPYFGLTFGSIEKPVAEIDIERWIDPLVKQARDASDALKKMQKQRGTFMFQLKEGDKNNAEIEVLLNRIAGLQHTLTVQQTEIQQLVCSMYLIYQKQNTIAEILGKTAPTIYSHYKKGHSELIVDSFEDIRAVLDSLQSKEFGHIDSRHFRDGIRNNVIGQAEKFFTN